MTIGYLDLGEMAEITGAWLGQHRTLFVSIPEIKPLLPHVERAHANVLSARKHVPSSNATAKERVMEENRIDRLHDHAYRSVWYMQKAYREYLLAQETTDTDELARLDATVAKLMPEGAKAVSAPFLAEAGRGQRARELLVADTEVRSVLGKLQVAKSVSGLDVTQLYINWATRMSEAQLNKTADPTPSASDEITPLQARNAWSKIVATVLSNLEHTADSATVHKLRGPFDAATERALERAVARKKREAASDTPK